MKKLLILLVIAVFSASVAVVADANADSGTKGDSSTKGDISTKRDSDAKVDLNAKVDFNAQCARCHRETRALPKVAKSLGVAIEKLALRNSKMSREEMIVIIEKGKDKMPGFEKKLTKEQITNLVDYLIVIKKRSNIRPSSVQRFN